MLPTFSLAIVNRPLLKIGPHISCLQSMMTIDSYLTILDQVCTLLDKRARRKVVFEADYVGFVCPDEFVVGEYSGNELGS